MKILIIFLLINIIYSANIQKSTSWNFDDAVSINIFKNKIENKENEVKNEDDTSNNIDNIEMVDFKGNKYNCEIPIHEDLPISFIDKYIPLLEIKDECATINYKDETYELCVLNYIRKIKYLNGVVLIYLFIERRYNNW